MTQTRWQRMMDRLRIHPWWPVHYRIDGASWWAWRGGYYRYRSTHSGGNVEDAG